MNHEATPFIRVEPLQSLAARRDTSKDLPVMPERLNIVVVESHQHVLEHIHTVLRRGPRRKDLLLTTRWCMVHFDAHPDMACPNVPALACFQPRREFGEDDKNLYDLLDSTSSGISEWILPLVLAANLQTIHWIRPKQQDDSIADVNQFALGSHVFSVGACEETTNHQVSSFLDLSLSAVVKVDYNFPYYRDDADQDSFVTTEQLKLQQTVHLLVSELPSTSSVPTDDDQSRSMPWMLDVCLDYFACFNPYLSDVQTICPDFARCLSNIVHKSMFYTSTNSNNNIMVVDRRTRLEDFRRLVVDYLEHLFQNLDAQEIIDTLSSFFEDQGTFRNILALLQESTKRLDGPTLTLLYESAKEAVPYLTMPHDETISTDTDQRLILFEQEVRRQLEWYGEPPFLVTMARSVDDGFTPSTISEYLQERILHILHDCLCIGSSCSDRTSFTEPDGSDLDGSSCRIKIVFDYGPWEGASL